MNMLLDCAKGQGVHEVWSEVQCEQRIKGLITGVAPDEYIPHEATTKKKVNTLIQVGS